RRALSSSLFPYTSLFRSVPLILGGAVFSIVYLFKWEPSKRRIDKFVLEVPLLTDLIQFSNFANFIAVMQVAYDAGVPIVECLYRSEEHTSELQSRFDLVC